MLEKIIQNFLDKLSLRNKKINLRIGELQKQAADIRKSIEAEMKKVLNAEMEGKDTSSINKKIRELRIDQADVEDHIGVYKGAKTDPAFTEDDIQEIKTAAVKARDERFKQEQKALQEYKDIEKKIEDLEREKNSKWSQYQALTLDKEAIALEKVASYIDPRSVKLAWDDRRHFLEDWIGGYDTERYFNNEHA